MTLEQQNALVKFARWAISEMFEGYHDLDSSDVYDKAKELGLITETTYDPEVHGESEFDCVPGDQWFVLSDFLKGNP